MYREFETETSYKYLQEAIKALKEPICVLGGWAVFFHVNKNFQQAQGRPYLGSRDIDLGFHLPKEATVEQLKQSQFAASLKVMRDVLKFEPVSFRLLKEVHMETGKEIRKEEQVLAYNRFNMYVDLIVDNIPANFKEVFGFQPIDEPLLYHVFTEEKCREEMKEFDKKLLLPTPEVLLGTKVNSLAGRDKKHKRVKDICDVFALLWYAGSIPQGLAARAEAFIVKPKLKQTLASLQPADYKEAGEQTGHTAEEIRRVLSILMEALHDGLSKERHPAKNNA